MHRNSFGLTEIQISICLQNLPLTSTGLNPWVQLSCMNIQLIRSIHFYTVINWNFYYSTPELLQINLQETFIESNYVQHFQRGKYWQKSTIKLKNWIMEENWMWTYKKHWSTIRAFVNAVPCWALPQFNGA